MELCEQCDGSTIRRRMVHGDSEKDASNDPGKLLVGQCRWMTGSHA